MEILSDATFKGNVRIHGGNFSVSGVKGGYDSVNLIETGYSSCGGNFLSTSATEFAIHGNLFVEYGSDPMIQTNYGNYALKVYGTEYIESSLGVGSDVKVCGSISLFGCSVSKWTDLNSILSFAKLKTFTSPSIPANCTAFEFTGTSISDTNKTHMIQVQDTSTGKSVIAETWITTNKKPAMSFAGCTTTISAGTYTAMVV